jgi:hypothetical protein
VWVWRAWHRLHPDRPQYGGGFGPAVPGDIPWWQLAAWAEHHGMTSGEFAILDLSVRAMDRVYRAWWVTHQKKTDGPISEQEIGK